MLLVEDSLTDIELIQEALSDAGCLVPIHVAMDGEEALKYLADEKNPRPDLILLDLNLPKLSGIEVLQRLKQDVKTRRIPVVMMTTSRRDEDIKSAYHNYVNAYVRKSHEYVELVQAVRRTHDFWFGAAELVKDV